MRQGWAQTVLYCSRILSIVCHGGKRVVPAAKQGLKLIPFYRSDPNAGLTSSSFQHRSADSFFLADVLGPQAFLLVVVMDSCISSDRLVSFACLGGWRVGRFTEKWQLSASILVFIPISCSWSTIKQASEILQNRGLQTEFPYMCWFDRVSWWRKRASGHS